MPTERPFLLYRHFPASSLGYADPMSSLQVHLTEEQNRFVAQKIGEGRYENADAVIRAALESLEREEQENADKLEALREAIAEGDASGTARGDVIARVKRRSRLLAKRV